MDFVFEERLSDAPFVERVWRTQSQYAGSFTSPAANQWEMVIRKHHGQTTFTIRGPSTTALLGKFPADADYFGIVFKLGTFMPRLPTTNRLNGNDVTLPEAMCRSVWLNSTSWQIPDYDNADSFVNKLIHDGLLAYDPIVDAVLQNRPTALSPRSLQYHFLRATGLTHKVIQQIERAQLARKLLLERTPILDTIHKTGYFDQAHLTNALKRFVGQTPAQITRLNQAE